MAPIVGFAALIRRVSGRLVTSRNVRTWTSAAAIVGLLYSLVPAVPVAAAGGVDVTAASSSPATVKTGDSLSISVTTNLATNCVQLSGAITLDQTVTTATTSWSFNATVPAGTDGLKNVTIGARPGGVGGPCTGSNGGLSRVISYTLDNTAPDTTIIGGQPANPTNQTSAAFTFTSPDGGATFECKLDAALSFTACTSGSSISGLGSGNHTFQVRAKDAVGNVDPTPASYSWTIDNAAPDTIIDVHPADPTNHTSATFEFHATESATFECDLDGGGFTSCSSPKSYSGPLLQGQHTFTVKATDAALNTDPSPATFTWTVDTTAPDTTILTQPANLTNSTSAAFTYSANEANSTFECKLDSGTFQSCPANGTSYSALGGGAHTFAVQATDPAGNTDQSPASYSWTIDLTAPDTIIDTNPANPTNQTSASFSFHASELGSTFECSFDGANFSGCSSPQTYSSLIDGQHTFQVRATDAAGNVDPTPASYAWTVDATPPDTTITGGQPANPTNQTTAAFTFDSPGDNAATFECSVDGGSFGGCTSGGTITGLGSGNHTFAVRAKDAVGNVDPTPASYAWTVDAAGPPAPNITGGPSGTTTGTDATFTFEDSESPVTFLCSLDGDPFVLCSSVQNYPGPLGVGPHTFSVKAKDALGNEGEASERQWTISSLGGPGGGDLNKTPELGSLALFGSGAGGLASYALYRLRSLRRRRETEDDELR